MHYIFFIPNIKSALGNGLKQVDPCRHEVKCLYFSPSFNAFQYFLTCFWFAFVVFAQSSSAAAIYIWISNSCNLRFSCVHCEITSEPFFLKAFLTDFIWVHTFCIFSGNQYAFSLISGYSGVSKHFCPLTMSECTHTHRQKNSHKMHQQWK